MLRLKQVFEILEEKPTGEHCSGMEGVIEDADALEKDEEGASFDSGIIGAALRTEHYEIAGYTAAIAMAGTLGLKGVSALLTKNLNEERQAAEKILTAAKPILQESANQPEEEDKHPSDGERKIFGPEEPVKMRRRRLPISGRTVLQNRTIYGKRRAGGRLLSTTDLLLQRLFLLTAGDRCIQP